MTGTRAGHVEARHAASILLGRTGGRLVDPRSASCRLIRGLAAILLVGASFRGAQPAQNHRPLAFARSSAAKHAGQTGLVIALRYPLTGAFGLMPHADWRRVDVRIDGHHLCVGSTESDPTCWLSTEPGIHRVSVEKQSSGRVLAEVEVIVEPGRPTIISALRRRKRGIVPGYRDGLIRQERAES